ncbi:MAG: FHA domain-containing protein [Candidatus Riflebacteria bacterium]|nr:FHA domain-containing protein [Candidatus Riflebacteria bacterium]
MGAFLQMGKDAYPLKELTFLGRDPACDVVIDEESVNGQHAVVIRRADDYLLLDFKSVNGTFVNGLQTRESALKDRDSIQVGGCLLTFRDERGALPTPQRESMDTMRALAELAGTVILQAREALKGEACGALFRPSATTPWWLLAGESPSLGPAKQGLLDEWACKEGIFYTSTPIVLDSSDLLEPCQPPFARWFMGISHPIPPAAELLLLIERSEDPAHGLEQTLQLLSAKAAFLAHELTGVDAPRTEDLPALSPRASQRGPAAARLTFDHEALELHASTVYVLGRDPARCDLVLNDEQVSRQHALLVVDTEGGTTLLDFKSVNGVFVGGKPVRRARLKAGDWVTIGGHRLHYEKVAASTPGPAGPSTDHGEPMLGVRARQTEVESFRQHFAQLQDPADILQKMMILVSEQFGATEIALMWVPFDYGQMPEQPNWLPHVQPLGAGLVPLIPLKTGVAGRAMRHVLTRREGFFVRDYNLLACRESPGGPNTIDLLGLGSFFVAPVMPDGPNLVVLVGATKLGTAPLGRADWGSILALVQAAAERLQEPGR